MKALIPLISCLLHCAVAAQTAVKTCPPPLPQLTSEQWIEKAKTAKNAGFLWKVEKHGKVSWLYGTIHVNTLELAMPSPTIVQAIKEVDIVALELDLSTPEKTKALTSEVIKLRSEVNPLDGKTVERIKKYTESLCLSADHFLKLPIAVIPTALSTNALRGNGIYPEFMVDAFIGGLGRGLKKEVVALETTKSQIAVLSNTNAKPDNTDLNEMLGRMESGEAQKVMQRAFDSWSKSDLSDMEQFPLWCECMRTPKEQADMERFNDTRNVDMARQITQMLDGGKRLFVAVGSLHMIGDKGLPALLSAQGAAVRYVPLAR